MLMLAGAGLLIAGATLLPSEMSGGGGGGSRWGLFSGDRDVADAIRNVILFAPLGLGLALHGVPLARAAAFGCVASGIIETLQLSIIPGRDASLEDLLTNSVGTALGASLAAIAPHIYGPPSVRKERAGLVALVAAWLLVVGSSALTLPALPESRYFGQWNHEFGGRKWEGARVLAATVGSLEIVDWELETSREVRQALLAGAPIEVLGVAGDRVERATSFLQITDHRQREIFFIGPDRDDLVFRYRMRATALGFDQPDLRLRGALAATRTGDTIVIRAWREDGTYCLRLNEQRACGLGSSAAGGWQLLMHPDHVPPAGLSLAGAAWLALLAAPFASLTSSRRGLLGGALILALAPAVSALLPGVLLPGVVEWPGLPLGMWAGHAAGARLSAMAARDGGGVHARGDSRSY